MDISCTRESLVIARQRPDPPQTGRGHGKRDDLQCDVHPPGRILQVRELLAHGFRRADLTVQNCLIEQEIHQWRIIPSQDLMTCQQRMGDTCPPCWPGLVRDFSDLEANPAGQRNTEVSRPKHGPKSGYERQVLRQAIRFPTLWAHAPDTAPSLWLN